tara:strand:- start:18311 stop:19840 length:1530 start_codon:yes stop_codon:yes gene_type:complete
MKILDCTIRDGGYYTNWDFNKELVVTYIKAFNELPVDYLEIGYRSKKMSGYHGEYFYCPDYVIKEIRHLSTKKLGVMLNEKDVQINDLENLLGSIKGLIDLVRIAVTPSNFKRSLELARSIKKMGFEVGINVMYMSKWEEEKNFIEEIEGVEEVADYFYMVDSYGGVYPEDIEKIYKLVRSKSSVPIGFHGHNNLEMALINTLTAIDNGVAIVDATITGMGRGAGNLKTELLLTSLNAKGKIELNFNKLSMIVDPFSKMMEEFNWGTNLPYMVSGANSLPQKDVMEWVFKRFYSFNSIITALSNKSKGLKDNLELKDFYPNFESEKVLIIGGGPSGAAHSEAIGKFLDFNSDVTVIHSSSKNVIHSNNITNRQIHCLAGNEGHRLESIFENVTSGNRMAILPPYPRSMGTYLPSFFKDNVFQLKEVSVTNEFKDSVTAIAIETALTLNAKEIYIIGYDGYNDSVSSNEVELFNENENLFLKLKNLNVEFLSLVPTKYKSLPTSSIYSLV